MAEDIAQSVAENQKESTTLRESVTRQKEEIEQLDRTIRDLNEDKAKNEEATRLGTQKLKEDLDSQIQSTAAMQQDYLKKEEKFKLAIQKSKEELESQIQSLATIKQDHVKETNNYKQKQTEVEYALSRSREEVVSQLQAVVLMQQDHLKEINNYKQKQAEIEDALSQSKERLQSQLQSTTMMQQDHVKEINNYKQKQVELEDDLSQSREALESQTRSTATILQDHLNDTCNYKQRQAEVEDALSRSREDVQKLLGEQSQTRAERDKYKNFAKEQDARLQVVEQGRPNTEDSRELRSRLRAAEDNVANSQRQLQSLSESFTKQNDTNSKRLEGYMRKLQSTELLKSMNEALTSENLALKKKLTTLLGQQHTESDHSPGQLSQSTSGREAVEQRKPHQRKENRVANRKPSSGQRSEHAGGRSVLFPNLRNGTLLEKTPEKNQTRNVSFASPQPAALIPTASQSSDLSDSEALLDAEGFIDERRLQEYHSNMAVKKNNSTGGGELIRQNQPSSRNPKDFPSHRTKEPESDNRNQRQVKGILKTTPNAETSSINNTPTSNTFRDMHPLKLPTPASNKSQSSEKSAQPKAPNSRLHLSKIVAGSSPNTTLSQANEHMNFGSLIDGSSRGELNVSGKRPAQSELEPKPPKRRTSLRTYSSRVIPDSQASV